MSKVCASDEDHPCKGTLEIREFQLSGWNSTEDASRQFPGHTRVNHGKYIVTDTRANIGTSNMVGWKQGAVVCKFQHFLPNCSDEYLD